MKTIKFFLLFVLTWLGISAHAQKEVYTSFDQSTGTLTYYCDDRREERTSAGETTEIYDPVNDPDAIRFNNYNDKVLIARIDKSMRDTMLTSTSRMFEGTSPRLYKMTEIQGMENLKTANVKDMSLMFNDCSSLVSLDLNSFNTAKVTNMSHMFSGCSALKSLDLSMFITANVKGMNYMFENCSSLTSLDLSSFNTDKVMDMNHMFSGCGSLRILNLKNFNTANVLTMLYMFNNCRFLRTILCPGEWKISDPDNARCIFAGCEFLSGEQGTECYGRYNIDIEYARLDGLDGKPGYFSSTPQPEEVVYTEYNEKDHTLTYYYDDLYSSRTGVIERYLPDFYNRFESYHSDVEKAIIDESMQNARLTSTKNMFYNKTNSLFFMTKIQGLKNLVTDDVTDMSSMFCGCSSLESLDLRSFNTINATDMSSMFMDCSSLESLDLRSFNTTNVTNMSYMFCHCSSLESLDLRSFNTPNVTDMSYMFSRCFSLKSYEISSSFKTDRVTTMREMFSSCASLESFDFALCNVENVTDMSGLFKSCEKLSHGTFWSCSTAKVTNMKEMFMDCYSIVSMNLYTFNTSNVTDMSYMFAGCISLSSYIDLSPFNTSNVINMDRMFANCTSLKGIDLSSFNTANVTDVSYMFFNCSSLESLDLSNFNTAKVKKMEGMFQYCEKLTSILSATDWNRGSVSKSTQDMFLYCTKLKGGNGTKYTEDITDIKYARPDGLGGKPGYFTTVTQAYTAFDETTGTLTYYYDDQRAAHDGITEPFTPDAESSPQRFTGYADHVKKAVIDPSFKNIALTSLANMLYGGSALTCLSALETIEGLENINYSEVTDMNGMFMGCSALKSLDLTPLAAAGNVKLTENMFAGCASLESLDLRPLNTTLLESAFRMFANCFSLKSIDLRQFNTSNMTDMSFMFADCSSLESLDLKLFYTEKVKSMMSMFEGCSSLKSVNLLRFNTANVKYMDRMFERCSSLKDLNLCSFDVGQVTDMSRMFYGCTALTTVWCNSEWSKSETIEKSEEMFGKCSSLAGGKGTVCDGATDTGKTFAQPDGGEDNKGYFTSKKEIYTSFKSSNGTLTYYCGKKRMKREKTELYDPTDETLRIRFKDYCGKVKEVVIDDSMRDTALVSTRNMFFGSSEYNEKGEWVQYRLDNVKEIQGLDNLVTDKVRDMSCMFMYCSSLESLDLLPLNTEYVADMSYMFKGCAALTTIWCNSDWNNIKEVGDESEEMFEGCTSLVGENGTKCDGVNNIDKTYARPDKENAPGYFTTINEAYTVFDEATATLTYYYDDRCLNRKGTVEMYTPLKKETVLRFEGYAGKVKKAVIDQSFKNAKLKSLAYMFCGGSAKTFLTALESVEGLDNINCDSKVTDMKYMFMGCYSLQQLDATLISTAGVKNMQGMFFDCPALTELNVNGFDISSATNMTSMFANCTSLTTIWCKSDWNISSVDSHDMFYNCPSLKGGNGTTYNENHIDNAYARTDKGGNEQGYFTRPSYPNGLFTVNDDEEQMMFSQGNLQFNAMQGTHQCADGTTQQGTWRFAINQWENAGMDNENISDSYNGWIDLFGWGTSGWDNGAKEYQPWAASKDYNDYLYSKDGLKGDYAYADWGVYNQIEDHQPGTWRTLSVAEWRYILNNRTAALGRRGGAIVNGVNGYILLPDDWEIPSGMTFNYGSGWNKNVYNRRDWNRMEMAGAIFLPAAGYREGTTMNGQNGFGYYFSNLPYGYASTNYFFFNNSDESLSNGTYSSYGLSVRLVRIPEDAPEYTLTVAVEGKGTVTGGGTFPKGTEVTLTATPDENYVFSKWSDGSTDNPHYIQLTEDMDITAIFIEKSTGGSDDNFGTFSVGANKTVTFSPGNLQYQASTGTWRFAENEWDYVGNNNAKISSTYDGWIDLFGWGTGNAPTLATYLGDDYADFVDWGTNIIGADAPDTWRTLTSDEWGYLINTRADAEQKYGAAKVNDIGGLVILPDMWTLPSNCSFKAGMIPDGKYSWYDVVPENTYTAEQWKAMQEAGAVFLPAAGYRGGTSVSYEVGRYWSSDPTADIYSQAYNLNFKAYDLEAEAENGRYFGGSVRLVKDFAQEQPEELEPLPGNETTVFDFSLIAPDGSEMLGVTLDAKDNYNKEEGRIEVASTNTAAEVDAKLGKAFSGTATLKPFLPGTITFELPAGEGTIEIDCQTVPGYTLQVRIAEYGEAYITSTIEQALRGKATVNYSVTQNTYVVIYLDGAPAGSAPARIARTAAEENAGAYIWSITVIPNKTPTGIDTTDIHQSANAKFVKDGILYIRHNGRTYTVIGEEVK
ncbi:MAG: BspA family leucine-rich repeat surface protein [Paludibacteraceae bacterium]|nr:BspA family leucine-rich repeat surface protein [Paludibacteraceae bacterium]